MMNNNVSPRAGAQQLPGAVRRPAAPAPRREGQASGFVGAVVRWFSVADHRYTLVKLALVAALLVYVGLVRGGNGVKDVPIDAIAARYAEEMALAELHAADANAVLERFGIDPDGCEGWLRYISDDLREVSELLIVKAPDDEARERVEAAAAARLESQKENFRNYGTDQFDKLEHAILWQRGGYLFYGVSDDVDRWEQTFLDCVR